MAGRRLKPVPAEEPRPGPPDLRDAVQHSIDAMPWLAESDDALKALALKHADEIEKAVERAAELEEMQREAGGDPDLYRRLRKLEAQVDATKTIGWLGQQLQGLLRDLGGTPATRKALKGGKEVGGRLAQIRKEAAGQHDP